jgi:hypothetical protein
MAEVITVSLVTMTLAIINHWVSDTGNETIAKKSACLHLKVNISKKSLYECKQQPSSISTQYQKLSILKFFPFSAGVVDTGDYPLLFEYLYQFS